MGIMDWLRKKTQAKSASNILEDLPALVAAVRTDVNEATDDARDFTIQTAFDFEKKMTELISQGQVDKAQELAKQMKGEPGRELSEADSIPALKGMARWRKRKAKVIEAQKKLYQDIALWSRLPPERSFNEVILPALHSGQYVGPSEPCFGPAVVAAFRVCEAAARDRGVNLEAHVSADILELLKDAKDLYK